MRSVANDEKCVASIFHAYNSPGKSSSDKSLHYRYLELIEEGMAQSNDPVESKRKALEEMEKSTSDRSIAEYLISGSSSATNANAALKSFASQYGVNSALQYLLRAPPPKPEQVLYSAASGSMHFSDVGPVFNFSGREGGFSGDSLGLLDLNRGDVSLRMTRSIAGAIDDIQLLGIAIPAFGCTLDAILKNRHVVHSYLLVLLRDDAEDAEDRGGSSIDRFEGQGQEAKFGRAAENLFSGAAAVAPVALFNANAELYNTYELGGSRGTVPQALDSKIREMFETSKDTENILKADVSYSAYI